MFFWTVPGNCFYQKITLERSKGLKETQQIMRLLCSISNLQFFIFFYSCSDAVEPTGDQLELIKNDKYIRCKMCHSLILTPTFGTLKHFQVYSVFNLFCFQRFFSNRKSCLKWIVPIVRTAKSYPPFC